ncbi:MAG: hypothetical protein Q9169_007740 [Polycauliona sp. 2 TL-2023]
MVEIMEDAAGLKVIVVAAYAEGMAVTTSPRILTQPKLSDLSSKNNSSSSVDCIEVNVEVSAEIIRLIGLLMGLLEPPPLLPRGSTSALKTNAKAKLEKQSVENTAANKLKEAKQAEIHEAKAEEKEIVKTEDTAPVACLFNSPKTSLEVRSFNDPFTQLGVNGNLCPTDSTFNNQVKSRISYRHQHHPEHNTAEAPMWKYVKRES